MDCTTANVFMACNACIVLDILCRDSRRSRNKRISGTNGHNSKAPVIDHRSRMDVLHLRMRAAFLHFFIFFFILPDCLRISSYGIPPDWVLDTFGCLVQQQKKCQNANRKGSESKLTSCSYGRCILATKHTKQHICGTRIVVMYLDR